MAAAARQSLRAPTRGSTGAEQTSAPSRRCSFLQEAAQKISEDIPQLAAELMFGAQVVARENNLPRGVFKGVSCCVACGYPGVRTHKAATACKLCEYLPRKRKRGGGSRPTKTAKIQPVVAQTLSSTKVTQKCATEVPLAVDDKSGSEGADEEEEKVTVSSPTAPPGERQLESLLPRKKKRKKKKKKQGISG